MSKKMTGAERIAAERKRQIEQWGNAHDDDHQNGDLTLAAICYAAQHAGASGVIDDLWPWGEEWWKPSDDPVRNLEKAGALIAAEIDRLLRKRDD